MSLFVLIILCLFNQKKLILIKKQMIKQLITFGCLLCFGVTVCYGQEVQKAQVLQAILIEGKVIQSTDKQPVIGATISVKNSKKGAISDSDGRFKIQAAIGDVLIISSIGYSNQEFKYVAEKI